jgi:hypothetical protein
VNTRCDGTHDKQAHSFPLNLLEALLGVCLPLIARTSDSGRIPVTPRWRGFGRLLILSDTLGSVIDLGFLGFLSVLDAMNDIRRLRE